MTVLYVGPNGGTLHGQPIDVRFWAKVDRSGGPDACWPWTRSTVPAGYGQFCRARGDLVRSHRMAYELAHGPIPEGVCILHRCDNPPCCNPAHLFTGTVADNHADMHAKGRGFVPPSRPGADHPQARLSSDEVQALRRRRTEGATLQELAAMFGVSISQAGRIARGESWGHLL